MEKKCNLDSHETVNAEETVNTEARQDQCETPKNKCMLNDDVTLELFLG